MPVDPESLPYRPCVGVVLFNRSGHVWIGHRIQQPGDDEAEGIGKWWQMPQGGIDKGEDPIQAARRELAEETGVQSARMLATARNWFCYDLPSHLVGISWKGRFRGQRQMWVAFRFEGCDSEIDISGQGHEPEFDDWRWALLDDLPGLIIPFKRDVYVRVVQEFRHLAVASA